MAIKDDDQPIDDRSPGEKLQEKGMYMLMGPIDEENTKSAIEWILCENYVSKRKRKELLLMVCSQGGDIGCAFALIDVMRSSAIPIKTVGLGQIASSGLLIFIAGTRGRRILTPNTSILSHQFSWDTNGKAHELFATVKEYELTQTRMMEHYIACTGLDQEKIAKVLLPAHDVWLTAQEAQQYGLCDSVSLAG